MKISHAIISLVIISVIYLGVLFFWNSNEGIFELLPGVIEVLPILLLLSLSSFILRYFRWRWLLARCGKHVPLLKGFLSYLTGFAFTATPGKIGELVRVRYFQPLGVNHHYVISAFIYERFFDLLVVLLISSLIAVQVSFFKYVVVFVFIVLAIIVLVARNPKVLNFIIVVARARGFKRFSRIILVLRKGLTGIKRWYNIIDVSVSLALGFFAWGLTSISFLYLLNFLGAIIPSTTAIAIYPLSMLAGAASMLPGGIGTTEASIVAILSAHNIQIGVGLLAAIGIRVATLWFAVVCGLVSIFILEYKDINFLLRVAK